MPRIRVNGKLEGCKTALAFFVQACLCDEKKAHPERSIVLADFSRECTNRWKNLSQKDKEIYLQKSEDDKVRCQSGIKFYTPKDVAQKKQKSSKVKDPNAPKKSLSAFFLFSKQERPKIRVLHPELSVSNVAKELGRMWRDAPEALKNRFKLFAAQEKLILAQAELTYYQKVCNSESYCPPG